MLAPFEVCLRSTPLSVRRALADVLSAIYPLRLEAEENTIVELVLAEVLNNVVKHAYGAGQHTGLIRVECRHAHDGLHFAITDRGKAMQNNALPFRPTPSVDRDMSDLPEGGFGWSLIRDLAKDVRYERLEAENRLTLWLVVARGTA